MTTGLTAAEVVEHVRAGPPRLGTGRLVCIDGPAGSGKTTLAGQVGALLGARVLHMDDLYAGWDGLFEVDGTVLALLRPLAAGLPGTYRRYDWAAGAFGEHHEVEPAPLLVLEGVGSGNHAWRDLVTTLVWVHAPAEVRLARGLARDGEDQRELWIGWMHDEERLFGQEGTRAAADLVLDTSPA